MKIKLLLAILLVTATTGYSQPKGIIGSWISLDTVNRVHYFIQADGTIEKRSATGSEDVWRKMPRLGNYTFKNEKNLIISWEDKSSEKIAVKFIEKNPEFTFSGKKGKPEVFLRIYDEEVIELK